MTTTAAGPGQVGRRVREAAAEAGISHVDLARHLGITSAGLGHKLVGRRQFAVEELARVASFLDTTVDDLVGFVP